MNYKNNKLPDVSDIIHKYQRSFGIKPKFFWNRFKMEDIKKVFLLAVEDFLEKKISIQEFSAICEYLTFNGEIWWLRDIEEKDKSLGKAMYAGAELIFNYKEKTGYYKELFQEIINYYKKQKVN